jgi:tetratricopeptide (TPR) repeat protein
VARLQLSAVALHLLGRLREAEVDAQRALAQVAGTEGAAAQAELLSDLAAILDSAGRYTEAEALHRRAGSLLVSLPVRGPHDHQRMRCARCLAGNVRAQGRDQEAFDILVPALASAEQLLGPDDPETLATMVDLAEVCARLKRPVEAERLYWQVLVRAELCWPEMTAEVAAVAARLSLLLEANSKPVQAVELARRAVAAAAAMSADPPGTGMRSLRLAELVLATLNRFGGRTGP